MSDEAMVDEFDTYATWTADAVLELGEEHALPAGCRGSGSPAALDWLSARMDLSVGTHLLDSGAGVGGPAAYVAGTRGVEVTLAEPMPGACRAAVRLFGHAVTVADGAALPFRAGAFDAAWSLGVLCTVEDKVAHLRELARVTRSGGAVGLLVFVRVVDRLPDQPEGNSFPDLPGLEADVRGAGLEIHDETWMEDLPSTPHDWDRAVADVESVIERDHAGDDGYATARRQSEQVGRLIGDGRVASRLLVCRRS